MRRGVIIIALLAAFVAGVLMMNFLNRDSCHDYGGMWEEHRIGGICLGIESRQLQ